MLFLGITVLTVISNVFLGLFVLKKNPKSSTHRLYLVLTIILSSWAITNYFSTALQKPEEILFWIRMVMVVTSPMFPTIYLITHAFPRRSIGISHRLLTVFIIFILICQVLAFTPLVFTDVDVNGSKVVPIPGIGIILYILNFLGFLLLTLVTLYKKNKALIGIEKTQFRYLTLGISLTFILAIFTNFVFVILLQMTELVKLGPLFTLILVGSLAYAVVKHKFLNIGLVVARTASFSLLVGLFGFGYTFFFSFLASIFVGTSIELKTIIASAILTLIIAFSFQSIRAFLEKITEKIFFKNNYSSNNLLSELTRILASTLKLEDLSTKTLNELLNIMHISSGAFYIFQEKNPSLSIAVGFSQAPQYSEETMKNLSASKKMMIFEEEDSEENKKVMKDLNISIALPLFVGEKIHGLLLLGNKKSGDIYFDKDIEVLKIFGPEMSVALENAKAYEEISRFNITLKEEIKKATQELETANERLQRLDQLKDEFVSLASHELRTPMTIIKSYLWLMLDKKNVSALSEKQKMYIERAYTSTQRLINLVNDMLNISRIESRRFTLNMQSVDIAELVGRIHSEILPKAHEQKINLNFLRPLDTLPKVQADPERVEQVLINILGNALKFTPHGTIQIMLTRNQLEKNIQVSVSDTGKGINKEDMAKLFQKFSMVGDNYLQKQNAQGTGLGLYLSKSIIELMGGKIWAESEGLGKGTRFNFTLREISSSVNKDLPEISSKPA